MTDLWEILGPIALPVALSLAGAFVIARYAGPAQNAYVEALEGRVGVLTQERDDAHREIPALKQRIVELEREVNELKSASSAKDREIADLYRRVDADERRMAADERRFPQGQQHP